MENDREAMARASYDFRERHARGSSSGAVPRGWDPAAAERERVRRLAGEVGSVAYDRALDPDEPFAESKLDAEWARVLFGKDDAWYGQLPLFGTAVLGLGGRTALGIMALGGREVPPAGAAPRRPQRRRLWPLRTSWGIVKSTSR